MTVGFNTTQGPTTTPMEADASEATKHSRNFLFAFLAAENKDQNTLNYQQIADANSTSMDANIESQVYQAENILLNTDAQAVAKAASGGGPTKNPTNDIPVANSQFQSDSANAQGIESVQNNITQTQQQASGQDSTNLQNLTQLTSTLTSVLSTIASLVGHAYT